METASLITSNGHQTVVLPMGISLPGDVAVVRKDGDAVILEPTRPNAWPVGFFEAIRVDDPAFERPEQGPLPPSPSLGV